MNRRDFLAAASVVASGGLRPSLAGAFAADPPAAPGDEMIRKYLAAETKRISAKFLDGVTTKEEWAKARARLKAEFRYMLGLPKEPEMTRTPLKATVTGTLERGDVAIEKLHYQSKPGLYVTANLYKPKLLPKDAQLPAILYVCGHAGRGRDGNKTAYQDHGLWFANNGYVCLMVDTLQLGEIAGTHHGTYREGRWWWHSRGYTPAGVECYNGIRGIDHLRSLWYVDGEKIGVTGISGGGAVTNWIAAVDERVKVAVPVSGVSDLESYVTDQVINGHCDCMFFHNVYQWSWTTSLALFAPKPLLFANSDSDNIFPMSGNKRIIARLRKCYEMLGAKDNVDEHVSKGGHAYRPDLRVAIFEWFHKHLKGDKRAVKDTQFEKIEGKLLRAFPEDKDIPKDAINAKADETFVPVAKVELPTEKTFKDWKAGLVKQLRERVFRALPEKIPAPEFISREGEVFAGLRTEPGIEVPVIEAIGGPLTSVGPVEYTVYVRNTEHSDNTELFSRKYGTRGCVIEPRGGPGTKWTRTNPPNTVERSLVLLGQTADSGRVRDVLSMLARSKLRLVGRKESGIIAAYAVLFRPSGVLEVVIEDPPTSHRDGPHFLNVMRVLDIPEALGLLAPDIKLTLVGKSAKDKAFDRTAAIYAAAGAKDKFVRE